MPDDQRPQLMPLRHQAAPLRNEIINALRRAIETGVLEPGTRLVEKDLCAELNVSRTSLREALRELQAEGVFEQTSSRSLTICRISRKDAEDAYRIRGVIEALLVEQFIENAGPEEFQRLIAQGEVLRAAYQSHVLENMIDAKRGFYDLICAGAGNKVARDIINRLVLRTSSLRWRSMKRYERQQQSVAEMDQLLKAIQERDVAAARQAAARHVLHSSQSALGTLEDAGPDKPAALRAAG